MSVARFNGFTSPAELLAFQNSSASAAQYSAALGKVTLQHWLSGAGHLSPQDAEDDSYWLDRFRATGPFRAELAGEIDALFRPVWSEVRSYEPVPNLQPPPRLYRAATEAHASRWSWYESFGVAKDVADMRGGSMEIWACEPAEVFGCVRATRREPFGKVRTWTDWIVRPGRVWRVPRWRDPFAPVPAQDSWAERGVTTEEAESIIHAWVVRNDLMRSPMDRESDQFWLDTFNRLGQFEAKYRSPALPLETKATVTVAPAKSLVPSEPLYRGAEEALAGRWSWTPDMDAAEFYRREYGPQAKIWTCEPGTVLGRIDIEVPEVPGHPRWPSFTEWVVVPNDVWLASEQREPRALVAGRSPNYMGGRSDLVWPRSTTTPGVA
jgi:hypothetical protein